MILLMCLHGNNTAASTTSALHVLLFHTVLKIQKIRCGKHYMLRSLKTAFQKLKKIVA